MVINSDKLNIHEEGGDVIIIIIISKSNTVLCCSKFPHFWMKVSLIPKVSFQLRIVYKTLLSIEHIHSKNSILQ